MFAMFQPQCTQCLSVGVEMQKEVEHRGECGFDVLFADGLAGMMAETAG